jgi:hypothetical protein
MHPTADTLLVIYFQRLGAAGDARRSAFLAFSESPQREGKVKMKNISLAKHSVPLFLFLTTTLLLILSPLIGNAQNSSTVERLEGTAWQGTMNFGPHSETAVKFVFTEDGQVKLTLFYGIHGWTSEQVYNYRTRQWETNLKPAKPEFGSGGTVCKYKRDGNSIQFNCYKRVWNATVQGNHMEGTVTLDEGTPQERTVRWSVERVVSHPETGNAKEDRLRISPPTRENTGNESPKLTKEECREAVEEFTADIVRNPNDEGAFSMRGWAKFLCHDYRGAIADLSKAIELEDGNELYSYADYSRRGDAKFELQDYRGAIADYNKVIQLYFASKAQADAEGENSLHIRTPESLAENAYYKRGTARNILGDKANACEDLRKSCKLGNSIACKTVENVCNKK